MDQLQVALSVLKKQYFWVASAAILLVALASWAKATRDAAQQYNHRKSKLEGDFQALQGIISQPNHPNDAVIGALEEKTAQLSEEVFRAWQILYQDQKAKNQLSPRLSQRFRDYWEATGPEDALPRDLREHYQIFIVDHIPKLFDMIGVRRQVARQQEGQQSTAPGSAGVEGVDVDQFGGTGSSPAPSERESPDVQMVGIVNWPDHEKLPQRFWWQSVPSTLRVRKAQEDLWVYEALLRVIKNTNEGATTYENAAVKQINTIQIGQEAIGAAPQRRRTGGGAGSGPRAPGGGGVYAPVVTGGETDVDEFGGPVSLPTTTQSPSGGLGTSTGFQGSEDPERAELLDGRYVDESGNPLGADQEHPYAEFKMMPIRLDLVMDQRKIRRLLGECANSSMPIEVKRVTIRLGQGQQGRQGSRGGRTGSLAGPSSGISASGATGMLPQTLPANRRATGEQGQAGPWDLPIEMEGIIYIYNPPNRDLLGTGAAAQEVVGGPETPTPGTEQSTGGPTPPATAPAGTPPTPPAPPAGTPPGAPPGAPGPPGPAPAPPGEMPGPGGPGAPAGPAPGPAGMPAAPAPPGTPPGAPPGAPPTVPPAAPPAGVPAGGAAPGAISP